MAIVPVVNSGTTPQVRRPRVTISEGSAVSGPFPIALQCTAANKFRPGPNDITVLSSRLAITASSTPPQTFPWGEDYGVSNNIGTTPVPVGYLWIRSIDANADGYDDLEVNASATIAQAFSVYSDNLVTINPNAMSGVGVVNLYGSGAFTSDNPLAGVGELLLSGEGTFIVAGMWSGEGEITFDASGAFVANNPMVGTGVIELSGGGAMTAPVLAQQQMQFTSLSAVDGWMWYQGSGDWTTARNASASNNGTNTNGNVVAGYGYNAGDGEPETASYGMFRSLLAFDTSSLPDTATIVSATLTMTPIPDNAGDPVPNPEQSSHLVTTTLTSVADNSYNRTNFGTTSLAEFAGGAWSEPQTVPLSVAGVSAISKTGTTYFGWRGDYDLKNTAPAAGTNWKTRNFGSGNNPTVAYRPVLTVNYTT